MSVFIIINHQQQYLGKQAQWLDADDVSHFFRTPHYDIALNQLIESNARDIEQRLTLLECPLDEKGQPVLSEASAVRKKTVLFDEPETLPDVDADDESDLAATRESLTLTDTLAQTDYGQAPAKDYAD